MWILQILLVLFTFSRVLGEESFSHDFGDDFQDFFNSEDGICAFMRPWIQGNYSSVEIDPRDPDSPQFVEPQTTFSCIYSNTFTISPGGLLELTVFMSLTSSMDQIRIFVYQDDIIVEQITSSLDHSNFVNRAWNTFSITIDGSETFDGYVAVIGRATSSSYILVDHLQYHAPVPDSEEDGDTDNESDSGSHEDSDTNEEDDDVFVDCIDYDFRSFAFDMLFESSTGICHNIDGTWERSSVDEEVLGIKPKTDNVLSCVSAPAFTIRSSGTLNITVRIESASIFDMISVGITGDNNELHFGHYGHIISGNITSDSQTLEIPLDIEEEYAAQITFIGLATRGATVMVEYFQFMPTLWDGKPCTPINEASRRVATVN